MRLKKNPTFRWCCFFLFVCLLFGNSPLGLAQKKAKIPSYKPPTITLPDGRSLVYAGGWLNGHPFIPLKEQPPTELKITPSPISCTQENFDIFFHFFSEDVAFQYANTQLPLKLVLTDLEKDVPMEILVTVNPYSEASWPIFPTRESRNEMRKQYTYSLKGNDMVVKLFIEGTCYLVHYTFTWAGCWKLTKIEDFSL